ncbi:3,4-dihydroxy-2-butanone-4-phosphate synthase [Roseiarcus sp.]|uniref:3,4-dihydroxy-2-butanone-4-phosphate synthase n=1 Tax=Roseiarcus sp. TaxID=1969460 RepID=UPI003F9C1FCE
MKLVVWLRQKGVSRAEFARRIGVSPGAVTLICRGDGAWLSRETAERIVAETDGAVTPNDFLLNPPTGRKGPDMTNPVTEAIEAFARGEIVVVTDDDDRENEGDMIVAASLCTTEKMAFIIRNGCGIVCAPLTTADARRLNLPPMVAANDAPLGTAFTVSVDVKHGLTTGISAEQRCNTVRALANGNMGASDFARPGHVFPLIAKEGGVLMRSGHTEAAVDLCKLAQLPLVAVICELANDDGTVMVGPQIATFAETHNLKRISVADLIAYRQGREKLVERVATFPVETPIGELQGYAYRTTFDSVLHFAFVHGSVGDGRNMPARLHRCDIVNDVFSGGAIPKVLQRFKEEGRGTLVYLRDGSAGVPVNFGAESSGSDTMRERQWREVGLGAQILRDLGVSSIRLRTNHPRTYVGLSGFGIEIASVEPIEG